MDDKSLDLAKDVAVELAKEAYKDGGTQVVKPTGDLVALLPRTIKAVLLPVEQWVMGREYRLAETEKLLAMKLENVKPEDIVSPEPHVAVPALQYISYCMDNEELRDMYANLLANSMNKVAKDGVHPSFVEIIKQLCPDEAKLMKEIYIINTVPALNVRYQNDELSGVEVLFSFSDIGEHTNCENPYDTGRYFDNLKRLGLIHDSLFDNLTDKNRYEPLKNHPKIKELMVIPDEAVEHGYTEVRLVEKFFYISDFGKSFCKICLTSSACNDD